MNTGRSRVLPLQAVGGRRAGVRPGSLKIGRYMPGTQIPVVDEARLYADQPDYAVIFSWHIADELAPKLKAKGFRGQMITPLPVPRLVQAGP